MVLGGWPQMRMVGTLGVVVVEFHTDNAGVWLLNTLESYSRDLLPPLSRQSFHIVRRSSGRVEKVYRSETGTGVCLSTS